MPSEVTNCPNPKCHKPISLNQTDDWCHHCGEYFSEEFKARLPHFAAQISEGKRAVKSPSTSVHSRLKSRYADAYLVAHSSYGLGQGIKVFGLVLGALIAIAGFAAASKLGLGFGLGAILTGAVVTLPLYGLGVLVTAQSQILKASLDTAVNSSPLLSHDEIRQVLAL